jgi:ubiquitin-protein ligase
MPPTYPFKPPTVVFTTKIYHPNISNDSPPNSGTMCLGMLRDGEWKPSSRISAVLQFALQLLTGMFFICPCVPSPKDKLRRAAVERGKQSEV